MNAYQKRSLAFCAAIFLSIGLLVPVSTAQSGQDRSGKTESPSPSEQGWHVDVTPYLWFAGVHGTAGVLGHEVSVHADAADVLSNFNIGFMGVVEPRYNRVIFPVDFMWVKLTDNNALPFDEGATTAKAEFNQTILTPGLGYRILDSDKIKIDGKIGIRYWHLSSSLSLHPSTSANGFSSTADWADGVIGGKIVMRISRKLNVTIGGDAGGGTARSDYQAYGLLGVRVSKKWTLHAGYRYMSIDYRPQTTFIYDMNMSGMLLGATWSVK